MNVTFSNLKQLTVMARESQYIQQPPVFTQGRHREKLAGCRKECNKTVWSIISFFKTMSNSKLFMSLMMNR